MYYIITKAAGESGKRGLLDTVDNRGAARAKAKELNGTVKTQTEYDELVATGAIDTGRPAVESNVDAVTAVVAHAAQVASQASAVAAEAAALLGSTTGRSASIMAMAHQIRATKPIRRTIGKQEKVGPKRPATDEGTLAQAREHLLAIARPEAKNSKVQIVRDLALWGGKKLQRKDVMGLIKAYPGPDLGIAEATISTQFQFARSGKDRQHG